MLVSTVKKHQGRTVCQMIMGYRFVSLTVTEWKKLFRNVHIYTSMKHHFLKICIPVFADYEPCRRCFAAYKKDDRCSREDNVSLIQEERITLFYDEEARSRYVILASSPPPAGYGHRSPAHKPSV